MTSLKLFSAVVALLGVAAQVRGHGYMKEPISRTSIHQRPEFGTEMPYWWDHQGVWCGNVNQDMQLSTCGRCGDVLGETTANQGGIYDKGVIVANYSSGSIIEVTAHFGAPHFGSFEIDICPYEEETDICFYKLPIVGGTETVRIDNRICVPHWEEGTEVTAQVQLPAGVTCNRCTLRWTYRTSYPGPADWDDCLNRDPVQVFRNCADIAIY
ncbi:uncharacterized protein LOC110862773 [Folsomia candida]|uniref:Chitin-binding type-4 domain-containing protein n=1 Tax=Folsomia candida TaxID=158441 RepID=A0A226CY38_FOLCA|nr:uncharacterized protein LOC110862773 [Folsomia candida]OXA36956.1 hypothetical protein Fcan01_28291 [Folsomia candida]